VQIIHLYQLNFRELPINTVPLVTLHLYTHIQIVFNEIALNKW